ncbi:MAG: hypothetical protein AB7P03_25870 [Kofleriaceae bacterium]
MSDKRQGSRDISDLKARLGLKKGAPAPAQARSNAAQTGVVPPPGMSLPPPPGVQPPQQPAVPNAADDPFAAMNHMAAVATVQRAPEIVIVNDGKGVEDVGHRSAGATLARFAVPGVVGLLIGIAVGKIGTSASSFNAGLADAKQILGDKGSPRSVAGLKQTLSDIDTLLETASTKTRFAPDSDFDKKLYELAKKLEVTGDTVFKAKQNTLNAEISGQIVAFYAGVAEVRSMIDQHYALATKYAGTIYKRNHEKAAEGTVSESTNARLAGEFRYGVLLQAPSEDKPGVSFGARLVEFGPPYCNGKISSSGKCADGDSIGYGWRYEAGGNWTQGDLITEGQDSVPSGKLVRLLPGQVRDSLVKGADGVASEAYYTKRLQVLFHRIRGDEQKTKGLIKEGNSLMDALNTETNRGTRFSFFM